MDDQLRQEPYGIHIPEDIRSAPAHWLAHAITRATEQMEMGTRLDAELGIGADLPLIVKAKAVWKNWISGSSIKLKQVEEEAQRRPMDLHKAINSMIEHIQDALRAKGYKGLVIIVDGLEKMALRPVTGQLTSHNDLFIYNNHHLKAPNCHLVYTLPLALFSNELMYDVFPQKPVLMPMVRVRSRGDQEDDSGLRLMSEIAAHRVAPAVFAPDVIKDLALASGGHIRSFLYLVKEAAGRSTTQVSKEDAREAVNDLTDAFNRTIRQDFIEPLDFVAANKMLPGSPFDGELVNLLLVLEYRNGETWNALHPCAANASRYKRSPRDPH